MNTPKAFLIALTLALAPIAIAQSDRAPADPTETRARDADPAETQLLRERIARRLEDVREQRRRLEHALQMLDDGIPADQVRREIISDHAAHLADRPDDRRRHAIRERMERFARLDADRPPPSPEEVERLLEFVRGHNPGVAADLIALRDRDPDAFARKMTKVRPRIEAVIRSAEERPERFRLMRQFRDAEHNAHRLARAIIESPGGADADLAAQLRRAVEEGFDVRFRMSWLEIEDLARRIDTMRDRADEWETNREQMIDRHVAELIDKAAAGELRSTRFREHHERRRDGASRREQRPREP